MENLLSSLNSQVKISDQDFSLLPLCNFHVIILAEPDPETWMTPPDDIEKFDQLLNMYSELILDEISSDIDPSVIAVEIDKVIGDPLLIMAGENKVPQYFRPVAEFCNIIFSFENLDFENLRYFLRGLFEKHSGLRVAILGGMFEDEVVRVANVTSETGFDTTIISRYCISSSSSINLDDLFISLSVQRNKLLGDNLDN